MKKQPRKRQKKRRMDEVKGVGVHACAHAGDQHARSPFVWTTDPVFCRYVCCACTRFNWWCDFFTSSFLPHTAWYIDHSKAKSFARDCRFDYFSHHRSSFTSRSVRGEGVYVQLRERKKRTITETPKGDPPHLKQSERLSKGSNSFFLLFVKTLNLDFDDWIDFSLRKFHELLTRTVVLWPTTSHM